MAKGPRLLYFQNTRKKGFKQVLERFDGFLAFPKQNSTLSRRKLSKN